jgi:hypothetical protein
MVVLVATVVVLMFSSCVIDLISDFFVFFGAECNGNGNLPVCFLESGMFDRRNRLKIS